MSKNEIFEVHNSENGKTFYWNRTDCEAYFGPDEFAELEQGYHPSLVVVAVDEAWAASNGGVSRPAQEPDETAHYR